MNISSNRSYHFIKMTRGLKYDVKCGSKVVIPAGTEGVKIAFGQSHLQYFNESKQCWMNMNVYLYKGKLYHA